MRKVGRYVIQCTLARLTTAPTRLAQCYVCLSSAYWPPVFDCLPLARCCVCSILHGCARPYRASFVGILVANLHLETRSVLCELPQCSFLELRCDRSWIRSMYPTLGTWSARGLDECSMAGYIFTSMSEPQVSHHCLLFFTALPLSYHFFMHPAESMLLDDRDRFVLFPIRFPTVRASYVL